MSIENKIKKAAQILSQEKANIVLYSTDLFVDPMDSEAIAKDGKIIGLRRGAMPIAIDPDIILELYNRNELSELLLPLREHSASKIEYSLLNILNNGINPIDSFQSNGIDATKTFVRFVFIPPVAAYGKTLKVLVPHQGIENINWSLLRNTSNTESIVYNLNLTNTEEFERFVSKTRVDFFGFSPISFDGDFRIIGKTSQLSPNSLKILGGPGVRDIPPELLFEALDINAICYGKGEDICAQMSKIINKNLTLRDFITIPNIAFYIDGKTIRTKEEKIKIYSDIRHNEDIPIDITDVVHRTSYISKRTVSHMTKSHLIDHVGEKRLVVEYSDHCRGGCVFCDVPRNSKKKSLEELFDEITDKLSTGEYDSIHFIDNTFSTYPKDISKISKWFIDNNLTNIPKACKLRTTETTSDMLTHLAKAGFTRIFYGIESFDDNILLKLQKGTIGQQNERTIQKTIELGMIPGLNIILPTHYDDIASIEFTIERTLNYVKQGATLNIVPHLYVGHSTPLFYKEPDRVVYKELFVEGMKGPYMMPIEAKFSPDIDNVIKKVNAEVDFRIEQYEKTKNETTSIHCYSLMHLSALSKQLGLHEYSNIAEKLIGNQ